VPALPRAGVALSGLSGLAGNCPPGRLIAPYLRREAMLSSRIEGTRGSLADVLAEAAE